MPIVIVSRLNSGIARSLETGCWEPHGIPALYKLLEGFATQQTSLDVILLCKSEQDGPAFRRITEVRFETLPHRFTVVPYYRLPLPSSKLRTLYNDCLQFAHVVWRVYVARRARLVYCDRSNLVLAAICRLLGLRTVVRFLGVAHFADFLDGWPARLRSPLLFLSLKVPHSWVVCSEDGSPGRELFRTCLNRRTPARILLNGIDAPVPRAPAGAIPRVLFVGRPTTGKGAEDFLQALSRLHQRGRSFDAAMLCGGYDTRPLNEQADRLGLLGRVTFEQRVPHDQVSAHYARADIYVSLNRLGNLSNTVLEAINHGCCLVILGREAGLPTDAATARILPEDAALRVARQNVIEDLTAILERLIDDPEQIRLRQERTLDLRDNLLRSWTERIDEEVRRIRWIAR